MKITRRKVLQNMASASTGLMLAQLLGGEQQYAVVQASQPEQKKRKFRVGVQM